MNNEPVAWMQSTNKELPNGCECEQFVGFFKVKDTDIPLYTHPEKTLTDEEIRFIAFPFESIYTTYDKQTDTDTVHTRFDQLGFAKAILKRASEK